MSVKSAAVPIYFRLTNDYNGSSWALDVVPDESGDLQIARSGAFLGQCWKLVPEPSAPNKYYLQTLFKKDYSLDIINDKSGVKDKVHLAKSGKYTGQLWTLDPITPGSTTYQLSNDFTGPDWYLGVIRFAPCFCVDCGWV